MTTFQNMIRQQKQCFQNPDGYQFQCATMVFEKYIRQNPILKNFIYPWKNYDWDYANQVEKLYNPQILGASSKGTIQALVKDIDLLVKSIEALVSTPNPDDMTSNLVSCSTSPDVSQRLSNIRNQIYSLQDKLKNTHSQNKLELQQQLNVLITETQQTLKSCAVLNSLILDQNQQEAPYKDPFFKKGLDKESRSSYYALTGMCPTNIKDSKTCEEKGYTWMSNPLFKSKNKGVNTLPGSCFRGKYIYMDNKPGISIGEIQGFKGLLPSLINNLSQLSPDKLAFVANGFGIPGLAIQSCDEGFIGCSCKINFIWIVIIILIIIIFIWCIF